MTNTTVKVTTIPNCEPCETQGKIVPAYADANIGGLWGNVCRSHFNAYGCKLGLGKGQAFILA